MHDEAFVFVHKVKELLSGYFFQQRVLEVGSLDINGSVRPLFVDCKYWGIDLGEGPGVDQVINIRDFYPGKRFDVVVSSEALEHDKEWRESLRAMYYSVESGGLLIFTCAGPVRPEHGTSRQNPEASPFTNEHYGNISKEDVLEVFDMKEEFYYHVLQYDRGGNDLQFFGIKKSTA